MVGRVEDELAMLNMRQGDTARDELRQICTKVSMSSQTCYANPKVVVLLWRDQVWFVGCERWAGRSFVTIWTRTDLNLAPDHQGINAIRLSPEYSLTDKKRARIGL